MAKKKEEASQEKPQTKRAATQKVKETAPRIIHREDPDVKAPVSGQGPTSEQALAKALIERPGAPVSAVIRDVLERHGHSADWDAILTKWTMDGFWFSHSGLRQGGFTPIGLEWASKLE